MFVAQILEPCSEQSPASSRLPGCDHASSLGKASLGRFPQSPAEAAGAGETRRARGLQADSIARGYGPGGDTEGDAVLRRPQAMLAPRGRSQPMQVGSAPVGDGAGWAGCPALVGGGRQGCRQLLLPSFCLTKPRCLDSF